MQHMQHVLELEVEVELVLSAQLVTVQLVTVQHVQHVLEVEVEVACALSLST